MVLAASNSECSAIFASLYPKTLSLSNPSAVKYFNPPSALIDCSNTSNSCFYVLYTASFWLTPLESATYSNSPFPPLTVCPSIPRFVLPSKPFLYHLSR